VTVKITARHAGYSPSAVQSAGFGSIGLVQPGTFEAPLPLITGNFSVGSTLTANAPAIGGVSTTVAYQWQRNGVDIATATARTYVIVAADLGAFLSVKVTYSASGYVPDDNIVVSSKKITTTFTAPSTALSITNTTAPNTTPKVGQTLTAIEGTWSPAPTSFNYVWKWAPTATGTFTEISGADGKTYVVQPADVGRVIKVEVAGVRANYDLTPKSSAVTAAVLAGTFGAAPTPVISGLATSGATLTVAEGAWSPTPDSFTYQWSVAGTAIAAPLGTGSSYVVRPVDAGKKITVVVKAVRAGYTTSTSPASLSPFAATPKPTITGTAAVGKQLTAVAGTWSPTAALSYVWKRGVNTIAGASASTYTLVAADVDQPITVTVTATLAGYRTTSVTSDATVAVAKGTFTTAPTPTIAGSAWTGSKLTATLGPVAWAPKEDSFTYQWAADGQSVASVAGKPLEYEVKAADLGKTITFTVTAKKNAYEDASRTSLATAAVTLPLIATAPTPTITGTVKVGATLTANPGVVPAGTTGATVKSYQWSSATTATGVYTNIDGATANTYVLKAADVARFVKVTVTWAKAGNGDTPRVSAATAVVASLPFTTPGVPSLSGTLTVGETLTAGPGTWSPTQDSFAYVWKRAATSNATTWETIQGQSESSYILVAADRGKFIRAEVTAIKAGYTSSTVSKVSSAAVVAPFGTAPTPTISVSGDGVVAVGKVLTAVTGSWSPTAALSYAWKRGSGSTVIGTGSTYTLTAADVGQPITVTVTGTLATYVTTSKASAATANVIKGTFAAAPTPTITLSAGAPAPFAPPTITATPTTITAVPGTWDAGTTLTYQWAVGGEPVASVSGKPLEYAVKIADKGKKITFTVTAKKAGYDDLIRISAETAPVTLGFITWPATPAPAKPMISGTAKAGNTLTATKGTQPAGATFVGYQWSRATTATGVYTNIANAMAETYTLTGADTAKFIKVAAIWSKTDYSDTAALSPATAAVAAGTLSSAVTHFIEGSANVGSTLTANEGAWAPTPDSFTYKWFISASLTGTYTAITTATARTYRVAAGDLNKFLKVEIIALKAGYTTSAPFRSAATTAVGPTLPN
jgi:hypothetical protein